MRLIHAADLHLDSAFGALTADRARLRRQESRDLVERLCRLCESRGADALLLAGDVFDGARVYPDTLEALSRALASLRCRVFIAPGNHDPYHSRSAYARTEWPENVHIFRTAEMEKVDCGSFVIYGAAFLGEESPGLLQGFAVPAEEQRLQIALLHGDVEGRESPYGPIRREEIRQSGLNYLALGHIHQHSGLQREGDTFYAYPGCPEGRGFDELGEKGVLCVDVERGTVTAEFIPLCRRRYEILTVDVTGQEPEQAVRAALPPEHLADIYRIILTGEAESLPLERLTERLREEFFYLELRDRTRLPWDLWARAGEDSLRGLFLARMREKYDAASSEEKPLVEQAVRFALDAMDRRDC